MIRVLFLLAGAIILIPRGFAQLHEKSPYKQTYSKSLRDEWQKEKNQLFKTSVLSKSSTRSDHLRTITPHSDEFVHIPDTAFLYALIDEGVDADGDSLISFSEADTVAGLFIPNKGITDLTGIEAFVKLEGLWCDENNIRSLNLSSLPELFFLSCGTNPIDSLDLSNNPALEHLFTNDCPLTTLDLSNNLALRVLWCFRNNLTNLDVSANVNLRELQCDQNKLESLDVSKNLRLKMLICHTNPLGNLDVSKNDSLENLHCAGNNLTSLTLPDTCSLNRLSCQVNLLDSVDVSGCPNLDYFVCYENIITSLDLSNNPLLNWLSCEQNQLTELDVSNNPELNILWCGDNLLNTLDLTQNSKIGSIPEKWDHLNVENMPTLGEVCVWDSFPGDAVIGSDGCPNICFEKGEACDGVCDTGDTTGIEDLDHSSFKIYPNPTSDILTMETSGFGPHSIRIQTLNGQEIYAESLSGTLHQIDLSAYKKGIYLLTIQSEEETITMKLVKH